MRNHVTRVALLLAASGLTAGCCCPGAAIPTGVAPPTAQADAGGPQVYIDLSTVRIPEAEIESALGALRPKATNEPRALTEAETQALWKRWRANKALRVVQAPKILALQGQEATVVIGETIRFARTDAVTNERGGLEFRIEDGPVFVGYQMRVVATTAGAGKRIALDLHTVQRTMKDGYSQDEIAAMDQETFLRQVVLEDRLDATFELQDGGHVVFWNPQLLEDAGGRYVTATLVAARNQPSGYPGS